jgi:hypothetical protein
MINSVTKEMEDIKANVKAIISIGKGQAKRFKDMPDEIEKERYYKIE